MSNVTVIGSQWGDEGKGKIVDWLAERADLIVRFQGGHNAGHTLVVAGTEYRLSLLPSGIVRPGKLSVIGNGVVIDPAALLDEITMLRSQGIEITPQNLVISETASLILPLHQQIDKARELARGGDKIGTTGRGIGPAYEDKVARRSIRLADLRDEAMLETRLEALIQHHNMALAALGQDLVELLELKAWLIARRDILLPFAGQSWRVLHEAQTQQKRILFEGAQGVMLDIDHGTYPYVTSSNTGSGQAATGSGVGPSSLGFVLGITKAYTTRVGSGPFPTEECGDAGRLMGERGREFGTVTGRKRRCGWFDAVLVRQASIYAGIHGMALTKLDILDAFASLKICIGYDCRGERLSYFPSSLSDQQSCTPIYEQHPGWQSPTAHIRKWEDLPKNARAYIARLEELTGIPVVLLSLSPERDATICRQDPFI